MINSEDRTFVRKFINNNCIARVEPGSQELPAMNGTGFYTWQFYLRAALYNPKVLNIIVQDFMGRYEEPLKYGTIQLCGVESSATALLTAIMLECGKREYNDVNVFSIRQNQKAYGRKNWIEGNYFKDKPAMLVDDIISEAHKTAMKGALVLATHDIPIANHCYALVYKTEMPQKKIKLLDNEVTVSSMFNLNHFDLSLKMYELNKAVERSIQLT